MRKSAAAAEFGRLFLRMVEQRSQGEWVRSQAIFNAVMAAYGDNEYVAYLRDGPGARRSKVPYVIGDVMTEFPHIERRKDGDWQNAPVWYRAAVGYRLIEDRAVSAEGFARWRSALEAGADSFAPGVQVLPQQGLFMAFVPSGSGEAGLDVHLSDQLPVPPWVVQINEPTKPGKENGLSAVATDGKGRRVLLRQGRLQGNPLSGLVVGDAFISATGLTPVEVAVSGGGARQWFVVAELDRDASVIRDQTAAFVAACAAARRISAHEAAADSPRLFAPDEKGGAYLISEREAAPAEWVLQLQGRVWQALAKLCATRGKRIRKPLHAVGYEIDVELPDAPRPLLIEIKTGRRAADVYTGVGQLTLYPRLIPWTSAHDRVLLLRGLPSVALVQVLADTGIALHTYDVDDAGDEVVFSGEFLEVCGLN